MRLGGEETRSDPYHAWVCGKQTFGPCLDLLWTFFGPCVGMIAGGITTTCGRNSRGVYEINLVDLDGFEPSTSSMPWKRAPNCATGPRLRQTGKPRIGKTRPWLGHA